MRFLEALFGGTPLLYGAVCAALLLALLLILNLFGLLVRGRRRTLPHRLAIVETARIDGRRQVVLLRRDGTEYMLLTGGPQDLVLDKTATGEPAADTAAAARPSPGPAADAAAAPDDMIAEAAAQLSRLDRRGAGRTSTRVALATRPAAGPTAQGGTPSLPRRAWRLPQGRDL
jgi:hypothetical protein